MLASQQRVNFGNRKEEETALDEADDKPGEEQCARSLHKPHGDAEAGVALGTAKFVASSSKADRLEWWKTRWCVEVGESDGSLD